MKRLTDFEGREESAGPLWDHLAGVRKAIGERDTIECTDHNGRVVGHMVDVTPRDGEDYPTLADCAAKFEDPARTLAATKRDLGMSRAAHAAERASPGWEEQALADLRTFARTHARFAVEDFRAAFPPPEGVNPKALGSVVRRAARERIVIADGYVAVRCSNMSPRIAWKSLVYDGSPKP